MVTMASSSPTKQQVYCEIRSIWVKAAPEELVRQALLRKMVGELGFPRELIAVEKELSDLVQDKSVLVPQRRLDVVCFKKDLSLLLKPLLVVECKDEPLSQKAIDQVVGYNSFLQAPFLSIVTPDVQVMGYWDLALQQYVFKRGFPNYNQMTSKV